MPATRGWNNGSVDTPIKNPVAFALSTVPTHKTTNIMRPLSHASLALQWAQCVGTGSAAERGLLRSGRCFVWVGNSLAIHRNTPSNSQKCACSIQAGRQDAVPLAAQKQFRRDASSFARKRGVCIGTTHRLVIRGLCLGASTQSIVIVRARIDTVHGPAWAAPKEHRHADQANAAQPFRQGLDKTAGTSGENSRFRVNDDLKGMLGNSRAWAERNFLSPLADL